MSAERWQRVKAALEAARELPQDGRSAAIAAHVGDDAVARREVEALLEKDASDAPFIELPDCVDPDVDPMDSLAGERIGEYRLVRPIASGGMGTVFEAIQDQPHRRVALKVMSSGLLSPSALRRFRLESETLAYLRHPGIAQIYGAGVHRGRMKLETPYFAMEYVEEARDLLSFVRSEELDLTGTLEIFLQVCDAVHFGHQKGVIHRDLKPANVLVGADGRPKVIDFGVARVVREGVQSIATRTGELVGTLHHMSPEQLSGDPRDVDVRSDVYALGVLLFQLLAGRLPYELRDLPLDEVARIIRDEPVARPPEVPEELGWILLRTLEKEPVRRYASVSELAADLGRFLAHEPVESGPPSKVYRLRKFVRRHRLPVAAGGTVFVALVCGVILATWNVVRAETEAAKFRRISGVLTRTLASVLPDRDGHDVRVTDILDRLAGEIAEGVEQPAVRASLHATLSKSYLALGLYPEAEREARGAIDLWRGRLRDGDPERLEVVDVLVRVLIELDRFDEALDALVAGLEEARAEHGADDRQTLKFELLVTSIDLRRSNLSKAEDGIHDLYDRCLARFGTDDSLTLSALELMIDVLRSRSDLAEAAANARTLVEAHRRILGPEAPATLLATTQLARIERDLRHLDVAEELLTGQMSSLVETFGEDHDRVLSAMNDLGVVYFETRQWARAENLFVHVLEKTEERFGPDHSQALLLRRNLETLRATEGYSPTSVASLREVYQSTLAQLGPDHIRSLGTERNLGFLLLQLGKVDEAEPFLTHALATCQRVLGEDHLLTLHSMGSRAYLHFVLAEYEAAIPLLEVAHAGYVRRLGRESQDARGTEANLGAALVTLGRYEEAIPILAESLRVHHEVLEPDDPGLIVMTINLGEALMRNDDLAQAEEVFREGLEHGLEHLGWDHANTLHCQGLLARVVDLRGRGEEASEIFAEVFAGPVVATSLPDSIHAALRLSYGVTLAGLSRFPEAERQLLLAHEIETNKSTVKWLAELYKRWERPDDASVWRARLDADD